MIKSRLTSIIQYAAIALIAALMLYLSTSPLITASAGDLVLDSVIAGVLLSILLFLLKYIVKYGNYSSMAYVQQIINYTFLGVVFTLLWVGGSFALVYLSFPDERGLQYVPLISTRIIISFLVYGFSILFFHFKLNKPNDANNEEEDVDNMSEEEIDEEIPVLTSTIEHIAVKNGQKIDLVYITDIIYIQAEGDYVMIYSTNGKYLKEQTMKSLECSLPGNKFVRVHRSSIVNIDYIQRIELFDKQSQILLLQKGLQVKMSITGYKLLRKVLNL